MCLPIKYRYLVTPIYIYLSNILIYLLLLYGSSGNKRGNMAVTPGIQRYRIHSGPFMENTSQHEAIVITIRP